MTPPAFRITRLHGGQVECVAHGDTVDIEVTQEKDDNQEATCGFSLTLAEAAELRDWLTALIQSDRTAAVVGALPERPKVGDSAPNLITALKDALVSGNTLQSLNFSMEGDGINGATFDGRRLDVRFRGGLNGTAWTVAAIEAWPETAR